MRPLIVHNVAGEPRRLNPMQVLGWSGQEIEVTNGRFLIGCLVVMAAGPPVQVRESEQQFDWLFIEATKPGATPADLDQLRELVEKGPGPG